MTADEARFAAGGYIHRPGPETVTVIHPDECWISAANVHARRLVCDRPGHPTTTSDCTPRAGDH
jgi:hypothetical protein